MIVLCPRTAWEKAYRVAFDCNVLTNMKYPTRVFLVLLRLAIGWHFFFEGLEKIRSVDLVGPTITNRPWSSQPYLRESTGPFAHYFRSLVGDPDREALDLLRVQPLEPGQDSARVPPRRRISPALDTAWNEYLERFVKEYNLSAEQETLARARLDQAKDQAVRWLLGETGARVIEKSLGPTATVRVKESPELRVSVYRQKVKELEDILNVKSPALGRDVEQPKLGLLKAEVNRLRTELLADLEKPMQDSLKSVLTDAQKRRAPAKENGQSEPRQWSRLDWMDAITRYGLTAVGAFLLLGLFTRSACLAGAGFLFLFALAMPALPWLPENPRAEGHYLFVTKNIIEMLALLMLATTPSGQWAGLDGLLYVLAPWRWRRGGQLPGVSPVADSPAL
jgi:uncharacterized membrane protein YphA (DoxX/SURF4 family)